MVVYAETNFVLELAFLQEQHASCEHLLRIAEEGLIRLVLPAFALTEGEGTLASRKKQRERAEREIREPIRELARSSPYGHSATGMAHAFKLLLTKTSDDELDRLRRVRERLLRVADLVPMDATVLGTAVDYEARFDLEPQDAVIAASVVTHLASNRPKVSCFLNRNSRDFDVPALQVEFKRQHCRLITRFDQGLGFVLSQS